MKKKNREYYGKLAGLIGIITNLFLFALKLFLGIISASISLIADAINNISDCTSSLITLLGFKFASAPADKEHPFGHQRIEYIAGLIVACLILVIGFQLGVSSVEKIITPEQVKINLLLVLLLIFAILVKVFQAIFYYKMGKKINSLTLIVTSKDSINDIITTTVVLAGLIFTHYSGINIDGYLGLAVALFIVINGIKMIKETTTPLIGSTPNKEFIDKIIEEVRGYQGVYGIHDVVVHMYGETKTYMTMHVEVSGKKDIMKIHDIIDKIEKDIKEQYQIDLVIHMDPLDLDNVELNSLKKELTQIILTIDSDLHYHDLRMVVGTNHTNLIFDIVIPYDYKYRHEEIIKMIEEQIKKIDSKYQVIINFDEDYLGN